MRPDRSVSMLSKDRKKRIGITTTVPIEPFLASGNEVVDLNNLFIGSDEPSKVVEEAQFIGYPRNICTWIKGLYAKSLEMDGVVGVVHGDCSNTESLLDTLRLKNVSVHPFSYPSERERDLLVGEVESLCSYLGTTIDDAALEADRVEGLRSLARKVDELRWKKLNVSAEDAYASQLSTSDFNSEPDIWKRWVERIISDAGGVDDEGPRLALIGVPSIITDLISNVEDLGGRLVFFETPRQFTMPSSGGDWINRYLSYTYPYSIQGRIDDIIEQVGIRKVDGVIHYVQSFCHRQIDDIMFRDAIDLPFLTVEGNLPGPVDERTKIRLEAFLDLLEGE